MEYSIIYTYYDDVLDCGKYAQNVFTFASYRKAVNAFYSALKNNDSEPVGISADFRIKKLDLFLHGDFRFCVYSSLCPRNNYFYSNLFLAIKCFLAKNKNVIKWISRAIFKYNVAIKNVLPMLKDVANIYKIKIVTRYN